MRWRIERIASELEHPIVHAQPQRADQRHFHSASGIQPEARIDVRAECLSVDAAAGCEVRLEAEYGNRSLKEDVAHSGLERGSADCGIGRRIGVLELESDDQQ